MDSLLYTSPVGILTLTASDTALTGLYFGERIPTEAVLQHTPILDETIRQLDEYFSGLRRSFTLPLFSSGTAFQRRVWDALRMIPYGETRTYAEIAALAGSPRGFRAVGQANHVNPISIIVPCHRVVRTGGDLGGYGGGLDAKRFLLDLEQTHTGTNCQF